jgi:hypothetical protein
MKEKEKMTRRKDPASKPPADDSFGSTAPPVNPVLASILCRTKGMTMQPCVVSSATTMDTGMPASGAKVVTHQDLAQTAVGRGIRHSLTALSATPSVPRRAETSSQRASNMRTCSSASPLHPGASFTFPELTGADDSLSQLATNYRNSLNDMSSSHDFGGDDDTEPTPWHQMRCCISDQFSGFLMSRDSSLVDLAMIPGVDDEIPPSTDLSRDFGLSFVDFPNPEVHPSTSSAGASAKLVHR